MQRVREAPTEASQATASSTSAPCRVPQGAEVIEKCRRSRMLSGVRDSKRTSETRLSDIGLVVDMVRLSDNYLQKRPTHRILELLYYLTNAIARERRPHKGQKAATYAWEWLLLLRLDWFVGWCV